jgi:hypothetical protein
MHARTGVQIIFGSWANTLCDAVKPHSSALDTTPPLLARL